MIHEIPRASSRAEILAISGEYEREIGHSGPAKR